MSIAEKVSSDIIVSTAINLSRKIRGLVLIPLITRLLSTASYGVFVQIEVVARLSAGLFRLGLERALVRYAQTRESRTGRADLYYSLTLVATTSGSVATVLIFVFAEQTAKVFLGSVTYAPFFELGSVLVPVYVLQDMAQNYYRSEMRVKMYSALEGVKTYLNVLSIAGVLLILDQSLIAVVTTVVIVETVFALVLQGSVISHVGLQRPTFDGIHTQLQYAIPAMVIDVFGMFQDRFDRILIGYYLGAASVGVYSVAYTVANILRTYILPLRISFFAEFGRLWEENDREQCRQFLRDGSRYFLALSIPSITGLYLIGEPFLSLLATPEVAAEATILLPIIATGLVFIGLEVLYRQLFLAAEETLFPAAIRVGGTVLNIGLNVVWIPMMGVIGAALATMVSYSVGLGTLLWVANRRFDIPLETVFAVKAVFAAATMSAVIVATGVKGLVPTLVFAPTIYFITLLALKGVRKHEFVFVLRAIGSTFR
ncbi:lipopolysaccharide biosynthesis protein [Saliphagus infecundisoli]|uniref:Lipopolysaccharide biosynthesis protein n=1 Tax=Saliphagus infecundisoli TaxID=1849069 RepID=A0ABD5QIW6_9EURY|nr:oligosaccharide flippase family protein [Saliphagus infecundisoli]